MHQLTENPERWVKFSWPKVRIFQNLSLPDLTLRGIRQEAPHMIEYKLSNYHLPDFTFDVLSTLGVSVAQSSAFRAQELDLRYRQPLSRRSSTFALHLRQDVRTRR